MNWITENWTSFMGDMILGLMEMFGIYINNIYFFIVDTAGQNIYIRNAEKFIVASAISLISLMVLKNVTAGYLTETDYDSEADPFNLIVKITQTVAVIMNAGWLFDYLLKLSKAFGKDLMYGSNDTGYVDKTRELLQEGAGSMSAIFGGHILMVAVIFGAMVVFSIIAGLRGAELMAMKLFLPYFALDLLSNSRERWNNFITAYIIAFFTYSFQILFFMLAMKSYASISISNGIYYLSTLVFLVMAIKTPKTLEKYIYRSGLSNAASSGMRMVVQTVVMKGAMA